ncbi:CGNR zinc finger domain-containing protein [Kineosporia succinea]|uniref:RNA-binding Zn ribbon-like protein n=1 Tax=Kineosporia succinea TaxID=84632 RepID=A0ABT9NVQ0_9ACTN|nr:CGNR zinc finger domain-containing protein [Kineosporia succinea]MDP9824502.1 putative RNA-binding Zn ribbon-like protein [Kineosporia succinea]
MDRDGAWSLIGGHPALDLVNTVSWRLDPQRRADRIASPEGFAGWLAVMADVPETPLPAAGPGWVGELRDALGDVLDAHVEERELPRPALEVVLGAWRSAIAQAGTGSGTRLPLTVTIEPSSPRRVPHRLAFSAGDLLFSDAVRRVRRCEGPGCGWFFLDTTRNHSRRWCDPADCGNRVRVRAYAGRRRSRAG